MVLRAWRNMQKKKMRRPGMQAQMMPMTISTADQTARSKTSHVGFSVLA
jgi:hypothetical protein